MKEKLKKSTYLFYGLGVGYFALDQLFNQWVQYYYLPTEKAITTYGLKTMISPLYLTIAFIIMRFVDAIADPVVGYLSDNSNSKFGRRSIFMLIGIIPLMLSMIAFFYPYGNSNLITMLYLSLIGSVYFVAYTLVGGPYNALIPDLARNQNERLNLSTIQSVFRLIFTAIPLILSPKLIDSIMRNKGLSFESSLRSVIIGFSVFSTIFVIISIFGLKEGKISNRNNEKKEKTLLKDYIKYLNDREIILYFVGFLFFFTGFNIIRNSVLYYVTAILGLSEASASGPTTILFATSAIFFPITQYLCKKLDYRRVMLIDLFSIIFGVLGLLFFGKIKIVYILMFAVIGAGVSGAGFIFPPAMLSEIASNLYEKYNISLEGMMFGIQGLFLKFAFLMQLVITTQLYTIGSVNGGATSIGVYITLIIAALFLGISFVCYYLKKN